jgi:hypothetical protein
MTNQLPTKGTGKKRDETVEKLDVESLIVDLLCCGLGGCVILFFIFSIKIIGPSFAQARVKAGGSKSGKGTGLVSLIGDNGKGQRMGAIRIVHLYNLSPDNLDRIKAASADPWSFWETKAFKDDPKLRGTLRSQVETRDADVSFILMADGMREVTFSFPKDLKDILGNTHGENNGMAEAVFIEGQSVKDDRNGYFSPATPITITSFKDFSITFKMGQVSRIETLLDVTGGKL